MTLPYDTARCSGRYDLQADGEWCPHRDTCQRYLAFSEWDKASGIPDSQAIPVAMGSPECGMKIEIVEDDMTPEQQILDILAHSEPLTANEIAQRVGCTQFEIRPVLWRMQATGEPIRDHGDGVERVYWLDDGDNGSAA
ncbi:helix-turn-helix domain-containing protein [Modicisalibacter coralii]|uniref:helix-turn-helix domain-containing protein n=1 Tax=Modicisalibacter coralii TaxID=2304602 RepID=UPI00100B85C6|nr:helix-turn-helix domain-containing protein [Halomonas coralii]